MFFFAHGPEVGKGLLGSVSEIAWEKTKELQIFSVPEVEFFFSQNLRFTPFLFSIKLM